MHGEPMQIGRPNGVRSSDWLGHIIWLNKETFSGDLYGKTILDIPIGRRKEMLNKLKKPTGDLSPSRPILGDPLLKKL